MTVGELRELLSEMPDDADILAAVPTRRDDWFAIADVERAELREDKLLDRWCALSLSDFDLNYGGPEDRTGDSESDSAAE